MPDRTTSLQLFIDYLKFEKRFSVHTIRAYHDDLTQFFDYLRDQFDISDLHQVESAFVRSWLASFKDAGNSSRTINRKISTLRTFFKFQIRQGIIQKSPMANTVSPKVNKRLPMFVKENEIRNVFEQYAFSDGFRGLTERLVLRLFYETGIRSAELVGLKETHINNSYSTIKVLGKGNKERVIPVNKELLAEMNAYVDAKAAAFENPDRKYLLVTDKGKQVYHRWIYTIVTRALAGFTTIEKRSPHILRHSFATHLTNNGAQLNSVKELLGHSSLAATQVYTHNTMEKLKEIHKNAHPRG
jgi:integrase/recombinase XerC